MSSSPAIMRSNWISSAAADCTTCGSRPRPAAASVMLSSTFGLRCSKPTSLFQSCGVGVPAIFLIPPPMASVYQTGHHGAMRYVALLRGINVGGKNSIKMAELKACLEKHGLRDVVTYIQSGNILFTPASKSKALCAEIEEVLGRTFNYQAS